MIDERKRKEQESAEAISGLKRRERKIGGKMLFFTKYGLMSRVGSRDCHT